MKRKLLAAAIIMATSMPAMAFRTFGIPDCGEWVGVWREQFRVFLVSGFYPTLTPLASLSASKASIRDAGWGATYSLT